MSRWPGRLITKTPVTPGGSAPNATAPGVWTLPEMAYWKKQGLWPDASADAYWGYVSYLMATSSLSNANNNLFVDSSGAFSPVSRAGNTTQGSVTPYGTLWSNYFDGSSYITMASGTAAGTGDFTIEGWFNVSSYSTGPGLYDARPNSTNGAYPAVFVDASGYLAYYVNTATQIQGATLVGLNTWNHFAVCRSGTSTRLFLNGVQQGSTYTDTNNYQMGGSRPIIGGNGYVPGGASQLTGYVSNLRVVNGTALYTTAFAPPTSPLTAISGTVLLTCQSNRFRDASTNNVAVNVSGAARVTPYSPFVLNSPGAVYNQSDISYWSGYFDGSGTLNFPANSAFDFGTGNFTMECWVCPTATTTVYLMGQAASNDYAPVLLYLTSGKPGIAVSPANGTWTINSFLADPLVLNVWTHLAVVRNGNKWSIYVNGVENIIAASTSVTPYTSSDPMAIGGEGVPGLNYPYYGYVSDARIVKGTAVYTSNFTPPTTPLTAISGTSLLTCQNAAFTDNSTNKFVATVSGTTTVTGNNPYQSGYYGNYFDGNGDGLSISNYSSSALAFGTSDFTIEFWAFATTTPNNNWTPFFTMGTSGGGQEIRISQNINGTGFGWIYPNNSNNGDVYAGYGAMTTNTWHHIAMTRSGSTMRLFLDGAVIATGTGVSFNFTNTTLLRIGLPQPAYADGAFTGYLSNLRIVKGTAVYTAAFTPPTAPLTAISGTGLLTCQANRLIDSSANAFALTKVGDTAVVPFDPFYTATVASNGGSMYFDGNGDYLSLPVGVLPAIGNFTAETWFYRTTSADGILCYLRGGTGSFAGLRFGVSSGGVYLLMTTSDGTWVINSGVIGTAPVGTWNHIAVVRNSGTITMYLNGTSIYSSTAIGAASSLMAGSVSEVGRMIYSGQTSDFFPGYMSDTRITSGTALYTGSFTPPTAPLTPSANTTLLLNGMNAGTYDAAMQNNLETVGNAQASSVQAKYGTTSTYFDGSGDYLVAPSSPVFDLGSGNFTIECWFNANSFAAPFGLASRYAYSGAGSGWLLQVRSATSIRFLRGNDLYFDSTVSTMSTSTWYHVAAVRNGSTITVYLNGTQVGQATGVANFADAATTLQIGRTHTVTDDLNGYIDDLRITKGVARYTSNFTPPTAALPIY